MAKVLKGVVDLKSLATVSTKKLYNYVNGQVVDALQFKEIQALQRNIGLYHQEENIRTRNRRQAIMVWDRLPEEEKRARMEFLRKESQKLLVA